MAIQKRLDSCGPCSAVEMPLSMGKQKDFVHYIPISRGFRKVITSLRLQGK